MSLVFCHYANQEHKHFLHAFSFSVVKSTDLTINQNQQNVYSKKQTVFNLFPEALFPLAALLKYLYNIMRNRPDTKIFKPAIPIFIKSFIIADPLVIRQNGVTQAKYF